MTLHPANLPPAEYVSETVRPFLAEFVKFSAKVATADSELAALRGREDQAKLEDAAALGELARADLDVAGFGAPALTKHLADVRQAEAKLAGFERAYRTSRMTFVPSSTPTLPRVWRSRSTRTHGRAHGMRPRSSH